MANKNEWFTLRTKMLKSKGYILWTKLLHLNLTHSIEQKNYDLLKNITDNYKTNDSLLYLKNREDLKKILQDYSWLLHNYLASMSSFVDHSRKFTKNLEKYLTKNHSFLNQYQKKVSKINENNKYKFLKDLRNYTLHYQLPFVSANVEIKNTHADMKKSITLEKKELLVWKGWTEQARNYIKSTTSKVYLDHIIEEYHEMLTSFYHWFYADFKKTFSKEIDEYRDIEKKIIKIQNNSQPKS